MDPFEKNVHHIFKETLKLNTDRLQIDKLFGHASYRTYYRVTLSPSPQASPSGGEGEKTFILMQMPEGVSSVSEEITNYEGPKDELPFVNIQRYLKSLGLPVPELYCWDAEKKIMVLEDVGDRHLETYLKDAKESMRLSFYRRAIDLLVEMQKRTNQDAGAGTAGGNRGAPSRVTPSSSDCLAFHRSFDEKLLNWEFDHFLEYGIEDRFKIKVPEEDKKLFKKITRGISKEIANSKYIFVHRDFQSRNIMMKDYDLYILDFQDALQGPETYDLVSLLRDSYIELSPEAVDELIDYFLEARKKAGLPIEDENKFKRLFFLTALQRKLKDTGRFQFINTVKGNPNFLVSVPSSLRYIRAAFAKLPEFEELRKLIAKYVKELD